MRSRIWLLGLVLVLGGGPNMAQAATAEAGRFAFATAVWLVPRTVPHHFTGYFVDAQQTQKASGHSHTLAAVFRGRCVEKDDHEFVGFSCRLGAGGFYRLTASAFVMDPTESRATLRLPSGSVGTDVTWIGKGLPRPGIFNEETATCDNSGCRTTSERHVAFVGREAEARGRLFGRVVATKATRKDFAAFGWGPYVQIDYGTTVFLRDGRMNVRLTILGS